MTQTPAFLWNFNKQLAGELLVSEKGIYFYCSGFENSHLRLKIDIREIRKIALFKLYNVSINGLKIISNSGSEDIFILENPKEVKRSIEKMIQTNLK